MGELAWTLGSVCETCNWMFRNPPGEQFWLKKTSEVEFDTRREESRV